MSGTTCPACQGDKQPRHYLCLDDWYALSVSARVALNRRDGMPAARRLGELRQQIRAGTPLGEIEITP